MQSLLHLSFKCSKAIVLTGCCFCMQVCNFSLREKAHFHTVPAQLPASLMLWVGTGRASLVHLHNYVPAPDMGRAVQDDFFEEALGLHKDGEEDDDDVSAKRESQQLKGTSKERSKGFAKGRGMGNKVRLRR